MAAAENATFLFAKDESRETAWCSHLHAQVRDGAVIRFLLIPFKKEKSSASINGKRMRQRDAAPMVLVSSSMAEK